MKWFEFRVAVKDSGSEVQNMTGIGEITYFGGQAQAFRVTR
jgi:hypothetical protein